MVHLYHLVLYSYYLIVQLEMWLDHKKTTLGRRLYVEGKIDNYHLHRPDNPLKEH
jgi:hypothetical protein